LVFLTSSIVVAADTNMSSVDANNKYLADETNINENEVGSISYEENIYQESSDPTNKLNSSDAVNHNKSVNSDYNSSINNNSITEENNLIPTSMTVERVDAYALTNITITAKVQDMQNDNLINQGRVVFKINGITIGKSNITNGFANFTYDISGLSSNTYTIYAKYTSDTTYLECDSTATLKVVKRPIMMSVSNKLVYSYTNVTLTATIVDKLMNSYLSEGLIVFKINGITVGTADIINGKANLEYDVSSLSPKNYTITAIYAGTKLSYDKQMTGTLSIIKRASSMTASQKNIYYGQNVTLVATVADKVDHTYVNEGVVVFKLNGKTVGTSNITSGKSYLYYDASRLSSKTYQISTTYSGTKFLSENWANSTLTIMPLAVNTTDEYNVIDKDQAVFFDVGRDNVASIGVDETTINKNGDSIQQISQENTNTINISDMNISEVETKEFTYTQIKNAAVNLRNMYESNHVLDEITVASSNMGVQDFLALLLQAIQNNNKSKTSLNISYKHYNNPLSYNDTIKKGTLSKKEYLMLTSEILEYMNNHTIAPEFVKTTLGNLGYYNIIYIYSKILDLSTTTYLPNTVTVYNWQTIHPENSTDRVIYISTDNIYSKTKDLNFINQIVAKLKSYGYTAYTIGVGPNTHNTKIWSKSLPDNAVQVSVFGGADAGVIYDVCTRSFMRTKANRLVYFVYNPYTAKNITNLSWLERAHDDNYSPSSFKGIANPDQTLLSHGYDYIYSYDVDTIVKGIIDYIS